MAIYFLLDDNDDLVILILEGDNGYIYVDERIIFVLDDDDDDDVDFIYDDDEFAPWTLPINNNDVDTCVDDEFASDEEDSIDYDDEFKARSVAYTPRYEESDSHDEGLVPLNEYALDDFISADDDYLEYHDVNYDYVDPSYIGEDPQFVNILERVAIYYMNHPDEADDDDYVDPDCL